MVRERFFRGLGLAAAGLILSCALAAQAGDPEAIEQKLYSEFKPTTISADRSQIIKVGDRAVIQKPGLTMYDVGSPMPPLFTYKNGKIGRGLMGFGKDVVISMKTPGGTSADYPHRVFAPGDKCWVTGVQVSKDGVLFELYSDAYEQTHYYAELKVPFPNKKEIPPVETVLQMVTEVLTAAPAEAHVDMPVAAGVPVCPIPDPTPQSHPGDVSGRYDFDEGDSQLNFISSDACIMLGPGGMQSAGKYRISGDVLTMDCTVTGSSFNLKIQSDKLVADDGHVWLRRTVAPPLPPSITIGQTKAQVTAALGQPAKISRSGAKETFFYKDMKVIFTNGKVAGVE